MVHKNSPTDQMSLVWLYRRPPKGMGKTVNFIFLEEVGSSFQSAVSTSENEACMKCFLVITWLKYLSSLIQILS